MKNRYQVTLTFDSDRTAIEVYNQMKAIFGTDTAVDVLKMAKVNFDPTLVGKK